LSYLKWKSVESLVQRMQNVRFILLHISLVDKEYRGDSSFIVIICALNSMPIIFLEYGIEIAGYACHGRDRFIYFIIITCHFICHINKFVLRNKKSVSPWKKNEWINKILGYLHCHRLGEPKFQRCLQRKWHILAKYVLQVLAIYWAWRVQSDSIVFSC